MLELIYMEAQVRLVVVEYSFWIDEYLKSKKSLKLIL